MKTDEVVQALNELEDKLEEIEIIINENEQIQITIPEIKLILGDND